jgi:hypothetical protein
MTIVEGAWIRVKALWPGIWKVSRVISGFNEIQWNLDAAPVRSTRTLIFIDRIVNDKLKRSFRSNCCEVSYASLLNESELEQLETLLASDSALRESFAKYQSTPHPLDLIANISLGAMSDELAGRFPSICDEIFGPCIEQGMTIPEVLPKLAERDLIQYKSKNPARVTLQLTCLDRELRSSDFVFRRYRTLGS